LKDRTALDMVCGTTNEAVRVGRWGQVGASGVHSEEEKNPGFLWRKWTVVRKEYSAER